MDKDKQEPGTELIPNNEEAGITHNCGVFGCIGAGEWPTQIDVAQMICLGLVALQHRYSSKPNMMYLMAN